MSGQCILLEVADVAVDVAVAVAVAGDIAVAADSAAVGVVVDLNAFEVW
jgi:hypothetical protein